MTNCQCELFNWLLVPLGISTFLSLIIPPDTYGELYVLYILTVIATLSHTYYGICVVSMKYSLPKEGNLQFFVEGRG